MKTKTKEELEQENRRLRELLDTYHREFRLCRWCANFHKDCSPTDDSCKPKWGGL